MSNIYFTSDTHYGHKGIILGCSDWTDKSGCRDFPSVEEHDNYLIDQLNKKVRSNDTLYHLGDFGFGFNKVERFKEIRSRIKCESVSLIFGNHDHIFEKHSKYSEELCKLFKSTYYLYFRSFNKQKITMCHYSMRTFPWQQYGGWMLYGHCFDDKTEVLTKYGWKNGLLLKPDEEIITLNCDSKELEWNNIEKFYEYDYSGEMLNLEGRRFSLCVTPNHGFVDCKYKTRKYEKFLGKDINKLVFRGFITSGFLKNNDIDISDNVIRLLVQIATDGSLEYNGDAIRFHLKKQRKIDRLEKLLNELEINYSKNKQKIGTYKIYFRTPDYIKQFSLKPLDESLLNASKRQAEIILEEYSHTDGNKQGLNSVQISSSKKQEIDLLQAIFVKNGISCNSVDRKFRGTMILSANTKRVESFVKIQDVLTKTNHLLPIKVWCVKVKNGTVLVRRNGKCCVTQNSHSSLPDDPNSLSLDVGVDTCLYGHEKYTPYSFDELQHIMKNHKTLTKIDHHGKDTPT